MRKFSNKSLRNPYWDYRTDGAYFVTINTKNRRHFFGEIKNGKAILSEIGSTALTCWKDMPLHNSHAIADTIIIMPDHIHGIIKLKNIITSGYRGKALHATRPTESGELSRFMSGLSPKAGSLSSVIRSYKSAVTKLSRTIDPAFGWQSLYHDRIIKTRLDYNMIKKYILDNPSKWEKD